MKIYTKTGDKGETALVGGARVSKADPRIEAIGAIDELNASLGVVLSGEHRFDDLSETVTRIQNHLFDIGAEIAALTDRPSKTITIPTVSAKKVAWLEERIDTFDKELTQLTTFILPGGTLTASQLHLARTICRRAERLLVTLQNSQPLNPELLRYINRLSDLLFTLARVANTRSGQADIAWQKDPG